MSIYKEALKRMKREEIDNHASDLYLKVNDISRELVFKYEFTASVKMFLVETETEVELWFDIPFAYDPYWEEKEAEAEKKKRTLIG